MDLLVSIIIPNFNRAHLIVDTLESIRRQDYLNWECLIIDDASTDNSSEIISTYIQQDLRFEFYVRPKSRPKGANSCRNYGFELSKGDLVQWFDSDDIMVYNHISTLVYAINKKKVDFAVGHSYNFIKGKGLCGQPFSSEQITLEIAAENYAKQKIGWITDDFLGKREIVKNLQFNEQIRSLGDEYNFFVQLLQENNNGTWVNTCLTYRRLHSGSSSDINSLEELEYYKKVVEIKFLTFCDIKKHLNRALLCWYLSGYMQYAYKTSLKGELPPFFFSSLKEISVFFSKHHMLNFVAAILSSRICGKGYRFLRTAIQY